MRPSKRPRGTIPVLDSDTSKRIPNGLRALLKSIHKFWPGEVRPEGQNFLSFANKFNKKYSENASRYGHRHPKALGQVIQRLEKLGDGSDIRYFQLRAYAEHVGLNVPCFLIYAQCVSYEAQKKDRAHIMRYLSECQRSVAALQKYLNDAESGDVFHKAYLERPDEYHAKTSGLKKMKENYDRGFIYDGR